MKESIRACIFMKSMQPEGRFLGQKKMLYDFEQKMANEKSFTSYHRLTKPNIFIYNLQ